MSRIVERIPAYSDRQMLEYCGILYDVLSKSSYSDEDAMERIKNSFTHYGSKSMEFRPYQQDIINSGSKILNEHGFVFLAMEVRTGKTLTSLGIADECGAKSVLFVTKKKAIGSIENDYDTLKPSFAIKVVNYESLHHVVDSLKFDLIIIDESHSIGAFPKPSNRAVMIRHAIAKHKAKVILLSGTPTPESYSQMYHQVYGIPNNPFRQFPNFYRFADVHVKVKQKNINGLFVNDYSQGLESIIEAMQPYMISFSQKEAGFVSSVTEEILEVEIKDSVKGLIRKLERDLVIEGKQEVILADTPVKLMMKVHQLCSGTIKFESGNSMVLDTTKAQYIYDNFCTQKIGIFYKFKEELSALKQVYGDQLTTDLAVFDHTDKSIALQIVSGREGISLRNAVALVYYNIDFSATSYWQSRDRMTTKERSFNHVYWVFSKGGIEHDIYKAVIKKKDYTINHFKKDFFNN
jgi:hypothetical protein